MADNVGEAGMLFLAREPYHVGDHVLITFTFPTTDVEIEVEAEVLHVAWAPGNPGGHFRVGVKFGRFEQGEVHPPLRALPC